MRRYEFMHIPKTGGSSVAKALNIESDHRIQHKRIIDDDVFKFTFVRNPWDRFVSIYNYCVKGSDVYRCRNVEQEVSFELFCDIRATGLHIGNPFVWNIHYRAQSDFIDLNDIDFIGRFENIQHDFDRVCECIGLEQIELQKVNCTDRMNYIEYYNDRTRDIIYNVYRNDIKHFGYEFDVL